MEERDHEDHGAGGYANHTVAPHAHGGHERYITSPCSPATLEVFALPTSVYVDTVVQKKKSSTREKEHGF